MDTTDVTFCQLTARFLRLWADEAADEVHEAAMAPDRRRAVSTARFAAAAIGWALADIEIVDGTAT